MTVPIFVAPQPAPQLLGYRAPLLAGDAGTEQTIHLMRHLVDEALSDSNFVRKAIEIVRSAPAYDDFAEVQAIYNWVLANIRFTKDPVTKEKLYPPAELLKIRAGDCDDISMLIAALGMAVGYNARFITLSANSDSPNEFSHVYPELEVPPGSQNWVPMDAARVDSQFSVAPPVYFRKRAWSVADDSYQDLSGTGNDWIRYAEIVEAHPAPGHYDILLKKKPGQGLSGCRSCSGGLGQDDDTDVLLSQALTEVPTIIAASQGTASSVTSPYGSFQTAYTPGAGIPQAGYGYNVPPMAVSPFASLGGMLPLLLIGGIALIALGGKR